MCVTAGDGNWYPTGRHAGSWKMLPKEVKCTTETDDNFVMSEVGRSVISLKNVEGIFYVPENYELLQLIPTNPLAVIMNYE
jgi:hypothetical protein